MARPPGARVGSGPAGLAPKVVEHPRVDATRTGPALLEVLPTHVIRQRFPQLLARVETVQPAKEVPDLALQVRVRVDEVLLAGPLEVQAVQGEQLGQLLDGPVVVVDPQVDVPVVVPAVAPARLDHQEGRRLLAPAVAARPLPGPKGFIMRSASAPVACSKAAAMAG